MKLIDFPYISADDQKSFARFTIENRLPAILQTILDERVYGEDIQAKLIDLCDEIPTLTVSPIKLDQSEAELWKNFFENYNDNSILKVPFFYSEVFFYRHLLEVVDYSRNRIDPFFSKKKKELDEGIFSNLLNKCRSIHDAINISLLGNKADLSQINRVDGEIKLILDQSNELIQCIKVDNTVHLLLDNAGIELFSDLLLAHRILSFSEKKKVVFYPKKLPILVSDATMQDIDYLLDFLSMSKIPNLNIFAKTILNHIESGQIQFVVHPFWNSPNHFTNLSVQIQEKIEPNDVLISKGDANYRRFFEDRNIPPNFTGAASICRNQFALRTLKSEIVSGIDKRKAKDLNQSDPNWMINGMYALIQKLV